MRNKTNRENTRQRKESHAQDNIYVVQMPTFMELQGFYYYQEKYNSAQEHSQETQFPITP